MPSTHRYNQPNAEIATNAPTFFSKFAFFQKKGNLNTPKQQKSTSGNAMQLTPDFHSKTAATAEQKESKEEER